MNPKLTIFFLKVSELLPHQITNKFTSLKTNLAKASMRISFKVYMGLSPEQDSLFWPYYDDFENERKELGRERIALVNEYLKKSRNISEKDATSLIKKSNSMEIKFKKLLMEYFKFYSKIREFHISFIGLLCCGCNIPDRPYYIVCFFVILNTQSVFTI